MAPHQRAVLVLRDVLGYRAAEVAEMLGQHASRRQQRAPAGAGRARRRARARRSAARCPTRGAERELLARFSDAFESGDVDAVVALLTEDAWIRMPPEPHEYQGRAAIAAFLRTRSIWHAAVARSGWCPRAPTASPRSRYYVSDPHAGVARAGGVFVLALDGGAICRITRFGDNGVLPYFGLPRTMPG